ncbi:MAG: DUF6286 domain-containing protein [Cumulibacter sp.]
MNTAQRIMLRVVSALVALALVVGGCLVIGQVVVGMTSGSDFLIPTDEWYDALRTTNWDNSSPVYVAVALTIVGFLLLLVAALTKGRLFTLAPPADDVDVVVPPRAIAQMLRRQAEAVPGVGSASAEVSRDLARISVTAPLAATEAVEQDLAQALSHGLKQLPWVRVPRLEIEVIGPREHPLVPGDTPPAGRVDAPPGRVDATSGGESR